MVTKKEKVQKKTIERQAQKTIGRAKVRKQVIPIEQAKKKTKTASLGKYFE